jgi:hypothetical protein
MRHTTRSLCTLLAVCLQGCAAANFLDRPAQDLDVAMVPVAISRDVATDSWIRHYRVFVAPIPKSISGSSFLALYFFPLAAGNSSKIVVAGELLEFTGVLGNSIKPFGPSQASVDSGGPFVVYLDYVGADLAGSTVQKPTIHIHDFSTRPNQSSEPTLSSVTPPAGQESRPR